ncbi:MAG: CocE/NonD family hydrolase, partial [Bryobacteraceae bacterium]
AQNASVLVEENVMAPMRDGVKLATDVYRPARDGKALDGKFPVILIRTPYNKNGSRQQCSGLAGKGYVCISQDCRGRFGSEGEFYAFVNEGKDGFDAIEWAASQPWSNGKVATFGGSYLAWDQFHASMYRPPHLVTMFAIVGGAHFLEEYAHPAGTPNLGWSNWILGSAASSPRAQNNASARQRLEAATKDRAAWLALHPEKRAEVFREFPEHLRMFQDYYGNPDENSYWKQRGFYTAGYTREMKDVPTMFVSGWFDYFIEGTIRTYTGTEKNHKSPKKLMLGPWPHGVGGSVCGQGDFGDAAAVKLNELALAWFDHWLKGKPLDRIGPEPVQIFRMGGGDGSRRTTPQGTLVAHGGTWRSLPAWPPPDAKPNRFFIGKSGELTRQASQETDSRTYVFDPDDPVPTIGGRYSNGPGSPMCPQDQVCSPKILGCRDSSPLNKRPDVLSFVSGPLEAEIDVTGVVNAKLWISSDAVDTDFAAKLIDVYPDGTALHIADGQIRARYRNQHSKAELLTPGKTYQVGINLGSVSNLFAKGHRIRLDITSSNYPKFEPNSNTAEPAGKWTKRVKAKNTVYMGGARASYVELPVRP